MEEPQSLASVVQNIMETLSDAVNQLILLVIALQEQNAAMPPHIPPAADAVAEASNTLTAIARGLATDEYEDYPEIQDEINQASDEMDASAKGLINAVAAINKNPNNRKQGWDGLLQASRIISGKTIRILEIVYGAEIKRLLLVAQQTQKLFDDTDLNKLHDDPDAFAQHVGELATKATELSQYVINKAADEESPLMKQNMTHAGDQLADHSAKLIDTANKLLEDPNDPRLRAEFEKEMKAIEKEMRDATTPMQEKLAEITHRNPEDLFPNAPPPSADLEPLSGASKAHKEGATPALLGKGDAGELPKRSASKPSRPGQPAAIPAIIDFNRSQADVQKAVIMQDPAQSNAAGQALAARAEDLSGLIKGSTDKISDPSDRKKAIDRAAELPKHAKEATAATADVARNPAKKEPRDKLSSALEKLVDDVDTVLDSIASPRDKIEVLAKKEQGLLDVLPVAVRVRDAPAMVEAIKNLVNTQQRLLPLVHEEAAKSDHSPSRQAQLSNAAAALDDLLPRQLQTAKSVLEAPQGREQEAAKAANDDVAKAMNAALEAILNAIGHPVLKAIQSERDVGDELARAAARSDPAAVDQIGKEVQAAHRDTTQKAKDNLQNIRDPAQKQKASAALQALDTLLPQLETAAKDYARNAKDPAKKSKFDNLNKQVNDKLDEVASVFSEDYSPALSRDDAAEARRNAKKAKELSKDLSNTIADAAARGDAKAVEEAIRDARASNVPLLSKAKKAVEKLPESNEKKRALETIKDLDALLPQQEAAAKDFSRNPRDSNKKGKLDDINKRIGNDLDFLADALSSMAGAQKIDPALASLLDEEERLADAVQHAATNASLVPEAEKAAKEHHAKLASKASAVKLANPVAEANVKRALGDLDRLVPAQAAAAKEAAQQPHNPSKKAEVEGLTDRIKDAIDNIRDALSGGDGDVAPNRGGAHGGAGAHGGEVPHARRDKAVELQRGARKAKDLGRKVGRAAGQGDAKAVDEALRDLKDTVTPLVAQARTEARDIPDTKAKGVAEDALKDIDALLPLQEAAARDYARNPRDQSKKGKFDDINKRIEDDLDKLAGALADTARLPAVDPDLQELLKKERNQTEDVADAASKSPADVEKHAKELSQTHPKLAAKANAAAKAIDLATENLVKEILGELDKAVPAHTQAAKEASQDPKTPSKRSKLEDTTRKVEDLLDKLQDALIGGGGAASGHSVPHAARDVVGVKESAKKAKALVPRVAEAAAKGDAGAVDHALKELKDVHGPLNSKAKNLVEQIPDNAQKQKGLNALKDLEGLLPQQEAAAKDLARNPRDAGKKSKLDGINKQINADLDDLAKALEHPSLSEGPSQARSDRPDAATRKKAQKQQRLGRDLAAAAAKGDAKAMQDALKDIQNAHDDVAAQARDALISVRDPAKRKRIEDLLKELDALLAKQTAVAKEVAESPKDPTKRAKLDKVNKKISDKLDQLADELTGKDTDFDALLQDAKEQTASVAENATRSHPDVEGVKTASRDAAQTLPKLATKAKELAKNSVLPDTKKKVDAALDNLNALLPKQEKAAKEAAESPKDPHKKAAVEALTDQIKDQLQALADALNADEVHREAKKAKEDIGKIDDAIAKDNLPAAQAAARALSDDAARLLPAARKAAHHKADPAAKKHLIDAIADAEDAFPEALEAVSAAARDATQPAKAHARKKLEAAAKLADEIANLVAPAPENDSVAAADKVAELIAEILEAAKNGDKEGVERLAKELNDLKPKLVRTARSAADNLSDPNRKKKLFGAIDGLDGDIDDVIAAAREVANNPNNPESLARLEAAGDKADKALNDLANNSGLIPISDARRIEDDLDRLEAVVALEDPEQIVEAMKDLTKDMPRFVEVAHAQADHVPSQPHKTRIQKPLAKLNTLLPEMMASAHEVIKDPSSEPNRKKLAKSVAEARAAAREAAKAIKEAPPVEDDVPNFQEWKMVEAAAKVSDLTPDLLAAAEAARDKPNDPEAQKRLAALVDKISGPLELVVEGADDGGAPAAALSPGAQAAAAADEVLNGLNELVEAALRGDVPAVEKATKDLPQKARKFDEKSKEALPRLKKSPERTNQLLFALSDAGEFVPQIIAAAKDAAKDPKDQKTRKALLNLNKVADDAVKLGKNAAQKYERLKKAEAPPKAENRLKLVFGKPRAQDPKADENNMRKLRKSGRLLDDLVKDEPPDWLKGRRIGEAIADLEKRLADKNPPKSGGPTGSAAGPKPGVALEKVPNFASAKKQIEDAIEAIKKKKHTELQAGIHGHNDDLKKIRTSTFRGDPQRVVQDMKNMAARQPKVLELAKKFSESTPDKNIKKKVDDAVKELEALLPIKVVAAKELISKPDDKREWDKLTDASIKAESALAQIEEAVNPTPATKVVALAKKSEASLPDLVDAAKSGNAKGVADTLKKIDDLNKDLLAQAAAEFAKSDNPEKTRKFNEAKQQLEKAAKAIAPIAKDAAANKDNQAKQDELSNAARALQEPLERIADLVHEDAAEAPKSEAKKQARAVLAVLKPKGGAKINPNHLIKAGQQLAGLMSDLVGKTKVEAYSQNRENMTERARAALDLDEMLSAMENSAKATAGRQQQQSAQPRLTGAQSIEAALASLTSLASTVPRNTLPTPDPNSNSNAEGGTGEMTPFGRRIKLSESINNVARDINKQTGTETDTVSVVSRDLAAELQRFAKADEDHRRQDMLISGRSISSHITRVTTEIRTLAAQCKDPVLQDKLFRHAQALRNFSIQLKILASVKAASDDPTANDAQLAQLTMALGNVITDVNTTTLIMRKTRKI